VRRGRAGRIVAISSIARRRDQRLRRTGREQGGEHAHSGAAGNWRHHSSPRTPVRERSTRRRPQGHDHARRVPLASVAGRDDRYSSVRGCRQRQWRILIPLPAWKFSRDSPPHRRPQAWIPLTLMAEWTVGVARTVRRYVIHLCLTRGDSAHLLTRAQRRVVAIIIVNVSFWGVCCHGC